MNYTEYINELVAVNKIVEKLKDVGNEVCSNNKIDINVANIIDMAVLDISALYEKPSTEVNLEAGRIPENQPKDIEGYKTLIEMHGERIEELEAEVEGLTYDYQAVIKSREDWRDKVKEFEAENKKLREDVKENYCLDHSKEWEELEAENKKLNEDNLNSAVIIESQDKTINLQADRIEVLEAVVDNL